MTKPVSSVSALSTWGVIGSMGPNNFEHSQTKRMRFISLCLASESLMIAKHRLMPGTQELGNLVPPSGPRMVGYRIMANTSLYPQPLGARVALVELAAQYGWNHLVAPGKQESYRAIVVRQCLHRIIAIA